MEKFRLDKAMVIKGLASNRSQAENFIRMNKVSINKKPAGKPGQMVLIADDIKVEGSDRYVSRAAYKLASVADKLKLDFSTRAILDIGSSTGGFTDYALQAGALKIIAVDSGTEQMDTVLKQNPKIELHEKTDIREFKIPENIDLVLIDVSFISIREVLSYLSNKIKKDTGVVAMVKPQFEAGHSSIKHRGVIKNEKIRREILKSFENWVKQHYIIIDKADSAVSGAKGNLERFYLLKLSS